MVNRNSVVVLLFLEHPAYLGNGNGLRKAF